jgi:hypothetical protein
LIKRLSFGARAAAVPMATAVPSARAVRVTVCEPLPGFGDCPWDRIVTEWFEERPDPESLPGATMEAPRGALIVSESVLRGRDWLDRRWESGGERLKHMALAVRADGLTREEFSGRWRAHAGTAGGVRIPDEARGLAYVQNHVLSEGWDGAGLDAVNFDAVNEVYFDDLAGLRQRVGWFAANPVADPLFGSSRFVCVRETVCG